MQVPSARLANQVCELPTNSITTSPVGSFPTPQTLQDLRLYSVEGLETASHNEALPRLGTPVIDRTSNQVWQCIGNEHDWRGVGRKKASLVASFQKGRRLRLSSL